MIKVKNLKKTFGKNEVLKGISVKIDSKEVVVVIGPSGSGKSTLIQHLNGLLKPTSGKIIIDGIDITDKKTVMSEVRKRVGLVFQYPEYQLFEETIAKDIAFGPKNLGLSEEEVSKRVKRAMEMVGLDYEKFKDLSPFEISGGQKRRVAIAGVVAMEPKVLILDEPIAGLDPRGRDAILQQIKRLHEEYKHTVILVTHSMEDVADVAEEVIVMSDAKIMMKGTPREVFTKIDMLEEVGLGAPQITYLMRALKEKGIPVREDIFTVAEAKDEIRKYLAKGGQKHD